MLEIELGILFCYNRFLQREGTGGRDGRIVLELVLVLVLDGLYVPGFGFVGWRGT